MMPSQRRRLPSVLLLAVILIGVNLQSAQADIWNDMFGWMGGEQEEQVKFYQEDNVATALMLADFINTPMYFVALFKYRDFAVYEDGRETNLTGFEADQIYTKVILSEILPEVGGELVYSSVVEKTTDPKDDNSETDPQWDAMAILYFPNSGAFTEMTAHPDFGELTVHKKAGLEETLVFACRAKAGTDMNSTLTQTDAEPVATVNFMKYHALAQYQQGDKDANGWRSGRAAAQLYYNAELPVAGHDHGMRVAMEFEIRHSLILSPTRYNELRILTFPSHQDLEAFEQTNNVAIASSKHHFQAGVESATTLQTSPIFVNSLGGNGQIDFYDACTYAAEDVNATAVEFDPSVVDPAAWCP